MAGQTPNERDSRQCGRPGSGSHGHDRQNLGKREIRGSVPVHARLGPPRGTCGRGFLHHLATRSGKRLGHRTSHRRRRRFGFITHPLALRENTSRE